MRAQSIKSILLVTFAFLLMSCRPGTTTQVETVQGRQTGTGGGRLIVADRATPKTFNFLHAGDLVSATVATYLMSSHLVEFDHDMQKYVPGLAESWEASDEGKTVTVKLREGLKFSDGAPLTAEDILFTLKVATDEKSGSLFRESYMIAGKPLQASKIDDRTIRFQLPRAAAAFESLLSTFGVLPRHKLENNFTPKSWDIAVSPNDLAVTGAYTLKEFVTDQRTILTRNPHYYKKDKSGAQLPYLDEIVIEAIKDPNTTLLKFQQGEVDLMDNIVPANFAALQQQIPAGTSVKDYGASMTSDFLWFNVNEVAVPAVKRAWFNDIRFKKAIAHALDRKTIIDNVLRGLGTPLNGIVSPANKIWGNNDVQSYDFNLQKARELLTEAGFAQRDNGLFDKGGNLVEITLIVDESVAVRKAMAAIIQEDLGKLGIKINVAPLEKNAFTEMIEKKLNYDAALHGSAATDTDPSTLLMGLKTGGAQRYWNIGERQATQQWEKDFDRLADEQDTTTDPAQRKNKFAESQKLFAEQLPMIPLVVRNFASGAKSNLGNYRPSVILPRSLWNAEELFWKK